MMLSKVINMKKTVVALGMLVALSSNAFAGNLAQDKAKIADDMPMLQTQVAEDLVIQEDLDANMEAVDYDGYVVEHYKETYVTHHQAKKMGLEKVDRFRVYEHNDIDKLSDEIAEQIGLDQPDYFSVNMYRDYFEDSGLFRYVAIVTEYR